MVNQEPCALKQKQEEPLGQIPPQYLVYPDKPPCDPPRFHFGVGVTYRQLCDYSVQHRLVPDKFFTDSRRSFDTIEATYKHLDCISGINLYLQSVRHPNYGWIVAHYSNYTWHYEEVEARQEQIVIDLIRRELNIQDMPQWHHIPVNYTVLFNSPLPRTQIKLFPLLLARGAAYLPASGNQAFTDRTSVALSSQPFRTLTGHADLLPILAPELLLWSHAVISLTASASIIVLILHMRMTV
ncbi:hypothetical protein EWM64_g9478 [Hericium alpestre]|uniref:Uncharacterized protein n=1 Tax=Hericium alpestre TaxID=135208 RepID=A0A4Y9ZJB4_9AGAM|nr:hypothetical protein EWM64_g9478 [Hericium alpestre]